MLKPLKCFLAMHKLSEYDKESLYSPVSKKLFPFLIYFVLSFYQTPSTLNLYS